MSNRGQWRGLSSIVSIEVLESRRLLAAALAGTGEDSVSALLTSGTQVDSTVANRRGGGVVAAAAAIASPVISSATANGRTHNISVTWNAVSGATGYRLERRVGATGSWTVAAELAAGQLKFTDTALAEQTTYGYRVSALAGTEASAPSAVVSATTAKYRLFDGTLFTNRTDPLSAGIETLRVGYEHHFLDWRHMELIKSQVQTVARQARDAGEILVLDIESVHIDPRYYSAAVISEGIAKLNQVMDWVRSAARDVKLGIINALPLWPPNDPKDPVQLQKWHEANDNVASQLRPVDYIFPGLYSRDAEANNWQTFVEPMLQEAQRFGKPVYLFVSMQDELTGQLLPGDFFRAMLATTRRLADGAVMWGGAGMNWDPNADWFTETQQFLAQTTRAAPASAPAGLTIDPVGARLAWGEVPADVDTLYVERSSDGVNFKRISVLGRDQRSWFDPMLQGGQTLYYRLHALNGFGAGGYSNVVSAMIERDGSMRNEAESTDGFMRDQRGGNIVFTGNGDWFRFRDVHIAEGTAQLLMKAQVPPQSRGMRLQVRLDSLSGPLVGDYSIEATTGFGDMALQSVPISGASGVRDVYLIYSGGMSGGTGNGTLDWWTFTGDTTPAAPTRLTTRSPGGRVELKWADNAGEETGYLVQRSVDGVNFETIQSLPPNSTTYVDESGDLATVYRYRVIATGATTDSKPSNVDTGRIGAISAFPRLEAESADKIVGGWVSGGHVANFANRSYLRFYAIDFGAGASSVSFNIAVPYIVAGQQIEIRLDDPLTGPVVGVLTTVKSSDIKNFNGTQEGMNRAFQAIATYSVQSTSLSGISGVHELFIVGRQVTVMPVWIGTIAHIDWMEFKPVAAAAAAAPASADTSTLAARGKGDRTLELKRKDLLEGEVAA